MKTLHFLLSVLLLASAAHAEQVRYISDSFSVPLRSGESNKHRIVHRGLPSGTKLTLLKESQESGFSQVRTEQGLEGWIENQYLLDQPIAKQKLEAAQKTIASLKAENRRLNESLKAAQSSEKGLQNTSSSLEQQNQKLKSELDEITRISADALKLDKTNKELVKINQQLESELNVLSTDHQRLKDDESNDAFLNGAFAVLIGVMITLIIPRLWPKKRSEWA